MKKMIIAIDGPAGSGKSTVAKRLADKLNISYLDTGAMYRGITLAALEAGVDLTDSAALVKLAQSITLSFSRCGGGNTLLINGQNSLPDGRIISEAIRSREVTDNSRYIADNIAIRSLLVEQQKQIGIECGSLVTEGRDQSTVVFPDAQYKFFLDARPEIRARRRFEQMQAKGDTQITYQQILDDQNKRDKADESRSTGALKKAHDARIIDTSDMNIDQVVEHLMKIISN